MVDNITVWPYNKHIDSKKHTAKYAVYKEQKMTAMQIINKVNSMLEQGKTVEQVLATWPEDSTNYNRAWGCLVAKNLVEDPEMADLLEGFGVDTSAV